MPYFRVLLYSVCVLAVTLFNYSSPLIVGISSFKQIDIKRLAECEPHDVLMLVDVDHTLVRATDAVLAVDGRLARFTEKIPLSREMRDAIKKQAHRPLIEPCSVDIIKKIQRQGTPVIACTAMKTGMMASGCSRQKWRYQHLLSLGFQGSFHQKSFLFPDFGSSKRQPVFYHGILCTDATLKGLVVSAFLVAIKKTPRCIVMVDDSWAQLESVASMCQKTGVQFVGYHYQRPSLAFFDEDVALFQIAYFYETKRWLSDEAARCESERRNAMLQNNEMSTCWSAESIEICK